MVYNGRTSECHPTESRGCLANDNTVSVVVSSAVSRTSMIPSLTPIEYQAAVASVTLVTVKQSSTEKRVQYLLEVYSNSSNLRAQG